MTGFFSWVVLGLLAGMLAKLIKPGRQRGGCILTTLLGVAGALLGGFIGQLLGFGSVEAFSLVGLAWATLGALVLLFVFGAFFNKK